MADTPGNYSFSTFINTFATGVESAVRTTAAVISRDNPLNRPTKHNADPYSTGSTNKLDMSNTSRVEVGIIAEAVPFWGWYKVNSFNSGTSVMCNLMSDSSQSRMGARRIGSLQPNTKVYFIRSESSSTGTIIGVEPEVMADIADTLAETITMASGHSALSEATNTLLYGVDPECLGDFSNGSPLDSTAVGERGWVCETGTAIFIDPFMSFIKADENCGFWSFHFDQLARMQGHNLQVRSAMCEQEFFDDNGEAVGYVGSSPYVWEGLGAIAFGSPTAKTHTPQEEQLDKPYLGSGDAVESDDDDKQMPYHRLQTYTGYLGQGFRQTLRLPPEGGSGVNKLGGPTGETVWEQHLALDGNYHLKSSQGITIAHAPLYRPPVRKAKIENDKDGDTRDNYKFSGILGSGESHLLSDTPIDASTFPGRALCSDDDVAYSFAWRNDHPFKYHTNDFDTIEPPDEEGAPSYSELSGQWYIDPPGTTTKKVDHRYQAKYNQLMSYFKILPDGTIVIAGPNGEEIRMVGGSIEISCPGDIQLRPGRNLISLAGRSTCLRSKEDIDIASTEADVRIKAERDALVLAGNGGERGKLVIENKFADEQGIVLKSAGPVNLLAEQEVYVRSGAGGDSRNIVLDAGGESPGFISMSADVISSFVSRGKFDHFGSNGSYQPSNVFTDSSTVIGTPLYSAGTMACLGFMICNDHLISTEGHIATALAKDYSGFVGDLSGDAGDGETFAQKADAQLDQITTAVEQANEQGNASFTALIQTPFRDSGRIGDANPAEGWGKYAFYFKSTNEYKAYGFTLYETRWQQRSRIFGGGGEAWTENPVVYLEEETYPYPGKTAWVDEPTLKQVDLEFYDLKPDDRIEDKKNPGTEIQTPPNGNYKIIG
jgi:hypothetical protein